MPAESKTNAATPNWIRPMQMNIGQKDTERSAFDSGRITGYTEIWERAEAEKQPQILPPREASRQDDSA